MSDLKALAHVKRLTGRHVHLGDFESVAGLRIESDTMTLGVNRAKARRIAGFGWKVDKRGTTLYAFRRNQQTGVWSLADTMTVWWSTDELHGQPVAPRDLEWEQLCYRPGTARTPLDNSARQAQGY